MKPPPRTRTKPDRNLKPEPVPQRSVNLACKWQRAEQRKLLNALKRLSRTAGGHEDIDYAFLRKYMPTRSISEIHSVVESLKNKVISCASFKLKKKRWEEKVVRKPIEVWTHMASAVAGTLEEPISTAFSQMLIVSSTEPRTLRNCDPPQVHRPPTDKDRPVGRTVPLRPMPRLPVQESAIVLDLLMSLPEELPLLDCNKLHKHLVQVYQCLSSPADSKIAREMFKDLKDGLCAQTEAPSGRDSNRTNSQQNTAGTADSSDVTDSGEKKLQPDEAESQSSGNTSSQSEDADVMGVCPPLNPFMVPLKLLMRQ